MGFASRSIGRHGRSSRPLPTSARARALVAFCAGRPSNDGWEPSRRYRAVAFAVVVLGGVSVVRNIAAEQGAVAATLFAVMWLSSFWIVAQGRQAASARFRRRHPYLDAALSIPYAAVLVLALLPKDWPAAVLIAIGAAFVALSFFGAHRRHQRRARGRLRARATTVHRH